jgi:hypothetical protein
MSRAAIASILLLLTSVGPAHGQHAESRDSTQTDSILVGDRSVRLTIDERYRVVGEFQRLSAGQLELRPAGADSIARYPIPSLTKLEVSEGTGSYALLGSVLGVLGGGIGGFVLGAALGPDCTPPADDFCGFGILESALVGTAVGAGAGLFTGLAIGASTERERWTPVSLETVRVGVTGGPSLGFVVSLTPSR